MRSALVFEMAVFTVADAGMKRRRLTLQERFIVRVTDDAVGRFDALHRRVANRAVVFQMRMRIGKGTGTGHLLPGRGLFDCRIARKHKPHGDRRQNNYQNDQV